MPVTIDYRIQSDQYESRQAWLPGQGRRDIPGLMWADVVRVVAEALGLPVKFYTRDFLTTMVFPAAEDELTVAFCSQGRRRGEVLLSIPATAIGAAALMEQLGAALEARQAEIRQAALDDGIPADYLDAGPEEDEMDW